MKRTLRGLALACLLAAAHSAHAQQRIALPVHVTIYTEDSFVRQYGNAANSTARTLFNDVYNYYHSFFGIEMVLDGIVAPSFSTANAGPGEPTTQGSLLQLMRANIPRVPPGTPATLQFSSFSNWFLVHRNMSGQAGKADSIGAMGKANANANLWISTFVPGRAGQLPFGVDPRQGPFSLCPDLPARVATKVELRMTGFHEVGHLLGAQHPNTTGCADSVMCVPLPAQCLLDQFGQPYWAEGAARTAKMDATNGQRVTDQFNRFLSVANPAR